MFFSPANETRLHSNGCGQLKKGSGASAQLLAGVAVGAGVAAAGADGTTFAEEASAPDSPELSDAPLVDPVSAAPSVDFAAASPDFAPPLPA